MEVVEQERLRVRDANNGPHPPCVGCPHLTLAFWNRKRGRPFLRALGVSSSLACNLKCDYCNQVTLLARAPERGAPNRSTAYEPQLAAVIRSGQLAPNGRVTLAGGEPILVRDFEKTLRLLCAEGLRVTVLTNAVLFSPALAELLASRTDDVRVLTSLDCGTPELYKTMKGSDLFLRALRNLGTYARTGGRVTAKYIISANNTAQREFVGFAGHLRREGIRRAAIAFNTDPATKVPATGPDGLVEATDRLRDALWRQSIHVKVMDFGLKHRGTYVLPRDRLRRRWSRWWGR
jgi:pyruvate-formate lyase-activating enzyme